MVHSYTLSSSSYIIIDIYNTCFYPDHRVLKTTPASTHLERNKKTNQTTKA